MQDIARTYQKGSEDYSKYDDIKAHNAGILPRCASRVTSCLLRVTCQEHSETQRRQTLAPAAGVRWQRIVRRQVIPLTSPQPAQSESHQSPAGAMSPGTCPGH